jgi:hypothetical protein
LPGCLAVRLPSQEGCNTNTHGEQVAGKASRASPFAAGIARLPELLRAEQPDANALVQRR